jgi:integrase
LPPLRATFASLLILAGNPLVTVQKLMRHSTPELTANLYAQLGLEDFSDAVETLPRI